MKEEVSNLQDSKKILKANQIPERIIRSNDEVLGMEELLDILPHGIYSESHWI